MFAPLTEFRQLQLSLRRQKQRPGCTALVRMFHFCQDVSNLSGLHSCWTPPLAVLPVPRAPAALLPAPCQPPGAPSPSGPAAYLPAETPDRCKQRRRALHCSQLCTASAQPHLKQGRCQLGGMLRQQVRPLLCQGDSAPCCGPLLSPLCAGQACRAATRFPASGRMSAAAMPAPNWSIPISTAGPVFTVRMSRTP